MTIYRYMSWLRGSIYTHSSMLPRRAHLIGVTFCAWSPLENFHRPVIPWPGSPKCTPTGATRMQSQTRCEEITVAGMHIGLTIWTHLESQGRFHPGSVSCKITKHVKSAGTVSDRAGEKTWSCGLFGMRNWKRIGVKAGVEIYLRRRAGQPGERSFRSTNRPICRGELC